MRTASWIIRHRDTGRIVCETFSRALVARLNTTIYEAVPILNYLVSLNAASPKPASES